MLDLLVRTSIQGGIAISVIYLALKAFPSIPPLVRLWIWRLMFLKLLIGVLPLGAIQLKWLAPPPPPNTVVDSQPLPTEIQAAGITLMPSSQLGVSLPQPAPEHIDPWLLIYGAGFGLFLSVALIKTSKTLAVSRRAAAETDVTTKTSLANMCRTAGIRRAPGVVRSREIHTAVLFGGWRPVLALPLDGIDPEDCTLAIAHEVAHLKHRDLEWSAAVFLVQSLFYFHPLVWLAAMAYRQSQEAAADECAIRLSNVAVRQYAEMLVRVTVQQPRASLSAAGALPLADSTKRIEQRLKDMKQFGQKLTISKMTAAAVLMAATLAMLPTYGLAQKDSDSSKQTGVPPKQASKAASAGKQHSLPPGKRKANKSAHFKHGSRSMPLPVNKPPVAKVKTAGLKLPVNKPPVAAPKSLDVTFDNVPAREALLKLCQAYGQSCTVSPDVSGPVTLFAHNLRFDQALKSVLAQIDATGQVQDGVLTIRRRAQAGQLVAPMASRQMNIPSLEFEQADARWAIEQVLKMSGYKYHISPGIQGTVTLSARNVTVGAALENILRQVDATYDTFGDTIIVRPLRRNQRTNTSGGVIGPARTQQTNSTSHPGIIESFEAQSADVRAILRKLFQSQNVSYSIAPEVQGTVTISLKNVTFETALSNVLRQVDSTYRVESGVYTITRN